MKIKQFKNGEIQIQDFDSNAPIIHSTDGNTGFLKLLLMAQMSNQKEAIIPYFGYSRQDKVVENSSSMHTICQLLKNTGLQKIYTFDIHSPHNLPKIQGFEIINYSLIPDIAQRIRQDFDDEAQITIVSPDFGSLERAELFAKHFFENQANTKVVVATKIREKGEITNLNLDKIETKFAIIVDDICTSGNTLFECKKQIGDDIEISVFVAHADFDKQTARQLKTQFAKIYTTNTIENPNTQSFTVFDIGEGIRKVEARFICQNDYPR